VIDWAVPNGSELVVTVAWSGVLPLSVPVRVDVPRLKVTVPLGIPAPGAAAATVAVNVTGCPITEGLADEEMVVLVGSAFTTWLRAVDGRLAASLASPP